MYFLFLFFTLDVNIILTPETVNVTIGENITLECQVNINIPSHMKLFWSGPISNESVFVVNGTSVSHRLVVPAKESYNGIIMFCNVSVYGTNNSDSATFIVRGNQWHHVHKHRTFIPYKRLYYFRINACDYAIKNVLILLSSTIKSTRFP